MYSLKSITILFLLLLSAPLIAQQKLNGIITEKNTGKPIAYATVQETSARRTLTNENGEFEISVTQLPVNLTITHLNYTTVILAVKTTGPALEIALDPQIFTLREVAVGNPAIAIMQEVSNKAIKTYDKPYYGKAFLRQIAYEDDKPTYLNEIFFDAAWKAFALISWHPTQARHLKGKNGISYTNLSFFSFVLSGYLGNSVHKKPLLKRVDSLYTFKLEGTYLQNGQEIAKIRCTPKPILKGKCFAGVYYVNTVTNDVLKIEGTVNGFKMSGKGPVSVINKESVLIAQYKLNEQGDNVLDYAVFNSLNRMKVFGIGTLNTGLYATLYMTGDENINKAELQEVKPEINDNDLVKAINYNDDFWKNNPGIRRTEKEQAAIEILEKIPQKK
jgi:hypothetical protein